MQFSVTSGNPERQRSGCVVVGIFESDGNNDVAQLSQAAERLNAAAQGYLSKVLQQGDMSGKAGQTLVLHGAQGVSCERVLLVGCGKQDQFDDAQFRKASGAAVQALQKTGAETAVCYLNQLDVRGRDGYWKVRQGLELAQHTGYRFEQTKSKKSGRRPALKQLSFAAPKSSQHSAAQRAVDDAGAVAEGVALARDLANLPGNLCTPSYLAEQALGLRDGHNKLKVKVLEEADMEKLGMGALLSVSRGSRQPAKLIVIEYRGAKTNPIVLVGKGLTFDAGGISLKPAADMDEMKYDMCGGASVLGALLACARLGLPLHVIGVAPCSENMPDGDANKPGDIVTSLGGQTIEILNTDAEGRLILCDALTYCERFDPDVVIDIATLTGACVVALGKHASGLFGNDQPLIDALLRAGETSGDRAWQMPLWDDYQKQLDSNFADIANIGGRGGGAVTAACFLSRFAKKFRWAHLDIAGTAWKSGKEKGATGRPVPLLMQYLLDRCAGAR